MTVDQVNDMPREIYNIDKSNFKYNAYICSVQLLSVIVNVSMPNYLI